MEEYSVEELRQPELLKANLQRSLEQTRAKASEILLFTLQWKDLEDHLDSVKSELEMRSQELGIREKKMETDRVALDERARKIEVAEAEAADFTRKVEDLRSEVEQKEKKLRLLDKQVELLIDVRKLVEDCSEELSSKRKDLVVMHESVKETQQEIESKERQLEKTKADFMKKVEDLRSEVEQKEKKLGLFDKQVELKEKELADVRELVEDCSEELSSKRKDLVVMQKSVKETQREIESKERQLEQTKAELERLCRETSAKEEKLGKVQNAIQACEEEAGRKMSDLEMLTAKLIECQEQLRLNEELLESRHKLLKQWSLELESNPHVHSLFSQNVDEGQRTLMQRANTFVPIQEPASSSTVWMQPRPKTAHSPGLGSQISPVILSRPRTPVFFNHQDGSGVFRTQCPASSSTVQVQALHTTANPSGLGYQTNPVILPCPQTPVVHHQDGSGAFHTQYQHCVGDKRPRIDAIALRTREMPVWQPMSPSFNSPSWLHRKG